jgi:hypothetical protein
MKIDDSM